VKPVRLINGIDITAHGGLIGRMVHRYKRFIGGCIEWEDLFQAGWLGVYHAAERFDPERGFKFSTYAQWWIRTFIQRAVMNERRTVRVPVHKQTDAYKRGERLHLDALSLDAPVNANESGGDTWLDLLRSDSDPAADAEQSDLEALVDAAVEGLEEKDRRIIRSRFWRDRTLGEIGEDLGVSRERIRQREANGLERLERRLEKLRSDV
jgi:RNA polymerase sigma factor (sigma-70 family)